MSNEITHKYYPGPGYRRLEFFVGGELFCTWWCRSVDELEENIAMFHKVYEPAKSDASLKARLKDHFKVPQVW